MYVFTAKAYCIHQFVLSTKRARPGRTEVWGITIWKYRGGSAPEFLNPHNDEIWFRAILDYAQAQSPRRDRQQARMADWRPVSWEAHFATTLPIIEG